MKTTVELKDSLFEEAKCHAAQHHTSLRAVLESALHGFLKQRATTTPSFRLRRATFSGNGLQAGMGQGDWSQIRSRIYEGQGG